MSVRAARGPVSSPARARRETLTALAAAAVAVILSCGEDNLAPPEPRADLEISLTTVGPDPDPDGYVITLDGGSSRPVPANGAVTFRALAPGSHSIEIADIAVNCVLDGPNPRGVTVPASGKASITLSVGCVALVGDLEVGVATTGADLDPDGYVVQVEAVAPQPAAVSAPTGGPSGEEERPRAGGVRSGHPNPPAAAGPANPSAMTQPVDPNGTVRFSGLRAGEYMVSLDGVAANCTVSGEQPTHATVSWGETAFAEFTVTCTADTGALDVTVTTTGDNLDPDGYTVTVDGTQSLPLGTSGAVTFAGLLPGDHGVEITGVAANCAVQPPNPRTVSVTVGATATTTFTVTCTALTGGIEVSVNTTGDDPDADGYTVTVDGQSSQPVGPNATVTFTNLPAGDYTVRLTGVAPNCTVTGGSVQSVSVPPAGTGSVTYAVSCSSLLGDLEVTVTTSGEDYDPDGYTVSVDGQQTRIVATDGTITFSGLSAGDHTVELLDVAANCAVTGGNPVEVTVPANGLATVSFAVSCSALVGTLEVMVSTTGADPDPDGYTVTVDGQQSQAVAPSATVTFTGLAAGDHSVLLQGIAANCSVDGANPVTVSVPANGSGAAAFGVTCVERLGDLEVSVATTGADPDPDGYTLVVDGQTGPAIGANASLVLTGLAEGAHTVALSGIADNCTVTGENPVTAVVPFRGTASAAFAVSCTARVGTLEITTATSGDDPDPDGYLVALDGGTPVAIGLAETLLVPDLAEGDHVVTLSGVAANCAVTGDGAVTATVSFGDTTSVGFAIVCTRLTGSLEVQVSTSGEDFDANGLYTVTVDGQRSLTVPVNGAVTFTDLDDGTHQVMLDGVAANCTAAEANPADVEVPANGTAAWTWSVTCVPIYGDIEIRVTTTGEDIDGTGYTITLDGEQVATLGVNDTTVVADVDPGSHTVLLGDVIGNCLVNQTNPQTVTVTAGATTVVTFTVTCVARLGDIQAITSTSGPDPDPDGYTVTVEVNADSTAREAMVPNDTVLFRRLTPGNHMVELTGVADNCAVSGSNPRTVRVPSNGRVTTTFSVSCAAVTGNLEVTTTTTGQDIDFDGYTVTVDGSISRAVPANGSVLISGLTSGNHSVALSGIESNCTVLGSNPQTVAVTVGETVTGAFSLSCTSLGTATLVGAGDIAACDSNGDEATALLLDGIGGTVFTAGDNVYENGTAAEFTDCYEPSWGRQRSRTRPVPGNHEYFTPSATPYFNYFGAAAGTAGQGWYSYDLGSWHIIALNSVLDVAEGTTQHTWLLDDLAANASLCTLAYFHSPLFTSGSIGGSARVRPVWDALFAAGVDVILNGDSHTYERFAPMAPDGTADAATGIRSFVVGTGGRSHGTFTTNAPNSEARDNTTYGVIRLTLQSGSYQWEFVPEAGGTFTDSGSGTCH